MELVKQKSAPSIGTIQAEGITEIYGTFGLQRTNLKVIASFATNIAMKISEEVCQFHRVVPIEENEAGSVMLAMADPLDMVALQIIRTIIKKEITTVWADLDDIEFAIGSIFSDKNAFEDTLQDLVEVEDELDEEEEIDEDSIDILRTQATDAPAVVFVNSLLVQAIQERASDIHIEPQENDLRIRLRIDGMLREFPPANRRLQSGVIARIKILADLDIAERRVPQDGRVKFKVMGRSIDVRCSTIPGIYGEKIVMRILDQGSISLNIDDLGFEEDKLIQLKEKSRATTGMILVTGPTGSGKTTTLYSILNYVNSPQLNIITVEDPVEYRLAGINQGQARPGVGLTFASALRSILRQDPDIVMVGEIRDLETAEIAVKAALTGHLVLSTLHTNNSVATIIRLLNMGIDKYLIVSSVSVIVAQRLVRRVCSNCREPIEPSSDIKLFMNRHGVDLTKHTYYKGKGCKQIGPGKRPDNRVGQVISPLYYILSSIMGVYSSARNQSLP
ncbi:MAG: Flp pilus assembly complex ATPase component TadA, partial [Candidatus Marinimicrobia bacterium]|nr:Flp pilus assembly complex ATPase component TadA [Candidatus Neomarinimicrobiota bacterium]